MFSIVIPLYNKYNFIEKTINSVLKQTFDEFELIVVNDGSTDGSEEIVKKIHDRRIRLLNKENGGVSSARNLGIKNARYIWIAFLDGDDLWEPNHLMSLYDMSLRYPEATVLTTGFSPFNKDYDPRSDYLVEDYFLEAIGNPIMCASSVAVKSSCFIKTGYFKDDLTRGEDTEMWIRLAKNCTIARSNQVTSVYRHFNKDRVSLRKYDYEKSFINTINLNNIKSESEYRYLMYIISVLLRRSLSSKDLKLLIKIIKQFRCSLLNKEFLKDLFRNLICLKSEALYHRN